MKDDKCRRVTTKEMQGLVMLPRIEGHFTHWKSVRDFFRTVRIFGAFFLKTKGFLPEVYEIFGIEMPLA